MVRERAAAAAADSDKNPLAFGRWEPCRSRYRGRCKRGGGLEADAEPKMGQISPVKRSARMCDRKNECPVDLLLQGRLAFPGEVLRATAGEVGLEEMRGDANVQLEGAID